MLKFLANYFGSTHEHEAKPEKKTFYMTRGLFDPDRFINQNKPGTLGMNRLNRTRLATVLIALGFTLIILRRRKLPPIILPTRIINFTHSMAP